LIQLLLAPFWTAVVIDAAVADALFPLLKVELLFHGGHVDQVPANLRNKCLFIEIRKRQHWHKKNVADKTIKILTKIGRRFNLKGGRELD